MLPESAEGDLFFDIEGDPFFSSDEVGRVPLRPYSPFG